ncbi:MAG: hypothetical protein LEGION0398_MBIBDBAK_01211 [Legionellaceae bacterium]
MLSNHLSNPSENTHNWIEQLKEAQMASLKKSMDNYYIALLSTGDIAHKTNPEQIEERINQFLSNKNASVLLFELV